MLTALIRSRLGLAPKYKIKNSNTVTKVRMKGFAFPGPRPMCQPSVIPV